ncbi:MAG: hypothetical protein JXA99_04835 [Candidatus Lokiarchaeota archaeon]|nr:hypothetical protein [Candidatus Lokiarchaeota archaeon]
MNEVFSNSLSIGLLLSIGFSIIVIFYLILKKKKYGTPFISILLISIVFIIGILYQIIIYFSLNSHLSEITNKILFKFVIVIESSIALLSVIVYSFLKQYGKLPIFSLLFLIFIFSLIIGTLISEDSINMYIIIDSSIHYSFNLTIKITSLLFNIFIIIFIIRTIIDIKSIIESRSFILVFYIYTFILFASLGFFLFYIIIELIEIRFLSVVFWWIFVVLNGIIIISKPELFLKFSNKIFIIHIYHKTGVLLYSYQFEKSSENIGESQIWGNILIGLNHILSEFTNKTDQIDILQTKNADIYVNYSNKYGFAILVLVNHKNSYIEHSVKILTKDFKEYYKEELLELRDINKIINVSEFKEAKRIIEKNFSLYL